MVSIYPSQHCKWGGAGRGSEAKEPNVTSGCALTHNYLIMVKVLGSLLCTAKKLGYTLRILLVFEIKMCFYEEQARPSPGAVCLPLTPKYSVLSLWLLSFLGSLWWQLNLSCFLLTGIPQMPSDTSCWDLQKTMEFAVVRNRKRTGKIVGRAVVL